MMVANNDNPPRPRFLMGRLVATPGAIDAMEKAGQNPLEFLQRHWRGDWGEVGPEDAAENELSVAKGFRIMSVYKLATGVKVWVITEADRSVTTILLPDEY
jgi:hypothetical protein